MNDLNIATSILSLTAPGTSVLSGRPAQTLARQANQSAASIRDSDPSRFGFFAALPPILESLPAAIAEVHYALDDLKADGVTLYTRYGPGNAYLGHEEFVPLWEALNEKHAVIFIHPTHSVDTNPVNPSLPQPVIDYPHETCRTILDLLVNDRIRQFPNVRIITSHAGGTFPYIATRATEILPDYGMTKRTAEEMMADARELYYDLALSGNEYQLDLLMKFAKPERILFGSDFPYAPTKTIMTNARNIDEYGKTGMSVEMAGKMARDNALALFPRLKN